MEQLNLSLLADETNLKVPHATGNFKNPLPMQYLGSKARIAHWIMDSIYQKFPECDTFFDLFSGTGSVAIEAAAKGYSIIANDIQPYSYAILKSLFSLPKHQLGVLVSQLESLKAEGKILEGNRFHLKPYLQREVKFSEKLITRNFDWQAYRDFCDATPVIKNNRDLKILSFNPGWCLFCQYYANNYFGIQQSLEIDTLRQFADHLPFPQKENLLAAVISVLTFAVSSTTHLAQYIKPNSEKQAKFLLKKRSISVINEVVKRIKSLMSFPNYIEAKIHNLDFLDALKQAPANKKTLVYVDPPYFKEHYSRYYHILDTFYLYDYPQLTVNDRTLNVTTGLYRENRIRSNFGLKSAVVSSFKNMLTECKKKGSCIAISYADTSLIDSSQMLEIIESCGFKALVKKKDLMHSGQGQPRNKIAQEYLYLLTSHSDE